MANVIENPILNSPYETPTRYWKFDDDGIIDVGNDILGFQLPRTSTGALR